MFAHLRITFCLPLLIGLTSLASSQSAQPTASQGAGAVAGSVKLGDDPAPGIALTLMPEQGPRGAARPQPMPPELQETGPRAVTDEKGRYRFTNIAAGRYRVIPLAEAFVVSGGESRFGGGGIAVTVGEGQTVSQIDFTLARGGVITGRVTDQDGRPVIAERLSLTTVDANGQARPFNGGSRFGFETDDRGIYRAYGLPAGRYLVSVGGGGGGPQMMAPGRRVRYERTYYPDAVEQAQAQIVEVTAGDVSENINIKLGAPMKTYAVSGRAVDADSGQGVAGVPVSVSANRGGGPGGGGPGGGASGYTNAEGKFEIKNLYPGRYSVAVGAGFPGGGRNAPTESDYYSDPASFEIASDNVSGVEVRVHQGASISGVVTLEGGNDPSSAARLSQLSVSANVRGGRAGQAARGPASGRQSFSQVSPNGSFRIGGLAPGRISLNLNGGGFGGGAGSVSIVRIERNGAALPGDIEVSAGEQVTGVRIVAGIGAGVIQGRVVIAGGALPAGTRLMVLARSLTSSGQNRNAQVDASGQFRFEGLMPGSYELRLNAITGGGFGGRQGQRGGADRSRARIPEVRQVVNVASGSVSNATLNLDLSQQQ